MTRGHKHWGETMKAIAQISAGLLALTMGLTNLSAEASDNKSAGKAQAQYSLVVEAPARLVWNAIYVERQEDPEIEYSKVLEESGNVKVLEQKFINIPLLGSVIAVSRQVEEKDKRIDYTLVRSDKFKALNGSWELEPSQDGKKTVLSLQSNLDIGIPFSNAFVKATAQRKMEKRLARIKVIAETEVAHLTASTDGQFRR